MAGLLCAGTVLDSADAIINKTGTMPPSRCFLGWGGSQTNNKPIKIEHEKSFCWEPPCCFIRVPWWMLAPPSRKSESLLVLFLLHLPSILPTTKFCQFQLLISIKNTMCFLDAPASVQTISQMYKCYRFWLLIWSGKTVREYVNLLFPSFNTMLLTTCYVLAPKVQ